MAVLAERAIETRPFSGDLHVGLVDAPRVVRIALITADALFHQRGIVLNPTEKRRVIDRDATLLHHLLKVPVAVPCLQYLRARSTIISTGKRQPLKSDMAASSTKHPPFRSPWIADATEPTCFQTLSANDVIVEHLAAIQARMSLSGAANYSDGGWSRLRRSLVTRIAAENLVLRQQATTETLVDFAAELSSCIGVIEACYRSHHLRRSF